MATVTQTEKTASTREVILEKYRKTSEKISNLKTVIGPQGRLHQMWNEYRKLKHEATLLLIALRIIKKYPLYIGMKGQRCNLTHTYKSHDGTSSRSYEIMTSGVFTYRDGKKSTDSPLSMILKEKEIAMPHLPHGASASSFIKKAWSLIKKAS